ncbi:hypothetical protein HK097_011543 [Rhizophlyctis rosea]|uniref:Organic solute transporter Ostalpha-domain-containing protein n=1 Tax=Rhizophlyctis rosea TaxID=64517 RepID=A0AAD5WZ60_9FUNG|nr:hypothetical protein HK097_011543 [Rhizophlyctis rosea]
MSEIHDECEPLHGPSWDKDSSSYGTLEIGFYITVSFAVLASSLSFYLCFKHFQYYWKPKYQSWIVRILLMVPVYAIGSCLSFRFFWLAPYIDIVRDCYEAFVVYSFFMLLQNYFAPNLEQQVKRLKGKPKQKVLAPFCCFYVKPSGQTYLLTVRLLCLQYVVLRPAATIIAFILDHFNMLCPLSSSPKHGQIYITSINFIASTVAVYGLFTFYFTIHQDIKEHKPLWKMIAVKFVIFFAFFQSIVLSILHNVGILKSIGPVSAENLAHLIQNFLVCIEMVIAAFLHLKAFGWEDFVLRPVESSRRRTRVERIGTAGGKGKGAKVVKVESKTPELEYGLKTPVLLAMGDALSPVDFLRDIREAPGIVRSNRRRRHAKEADRRKARLDGEGGVGSGGRKKTRQGTTKITRLGTAAASVVALGTGADVAAGGSSASRPTDDDMIVAVEEGVGHDDVDSDSVYDSSDYDSDDNSSLFTIHSGVSSSSASTTSSGVSHAGSRSDELLIPK